MAPLLRRLGIIALISVVALIGNPSTLLPGTFSERAPFDFSSMSVIDLLLEADPTIPPEWAGVWEWTETEVDCITELPLGPSDTYIDTMCTGASVGDETDPTIEITCTGTATANSFDVTCTGSFEIFPGCTQNVQIHTQGTRDGETAEATTELNTTYEGVGCFFEDFCLRMVNSGERLAPEPESCTTPVEPSTWGAIKERFQ